MVTANSVVTAEAPPGTAPRYVALGSSFAAGPGLGPVADVDCLRSALNYPAQLAGKLGFSLVDVTCSGATTADVTDRGQQLRGGKTLPRQMEAVTADTELVSITIGGNDLAMSANMIAQSCGHGLAGGIPIASHLAAAACATVAGTSPEPTTSEYTRVQTAITDVVRAVQRKAPRATVLLVTCLSSTGPPPLVTTFQ
ncbi:GDSL-type esterase/lipase family protein [Nocardia sp. NPDC055049]